MAANKWTDQQLQAIEARDSDILVSAAAGSGKTAVLVERIIRRITDELDTPIDIDRLLVVTFTKAAAAEMSQRIGTAIAKKLETTPQNIHLQNQMVLLGKADIKTIHAFCLQVIREYYYILNIDPATRTVDPSEGRMLQREVLDELFEVLYEAENAEFFLLLESFADGTKDSKLKDLILKIYNFAQGYPDPEVLLDKMTEQFHLSEADTVDSCVWIGLIQAGVSNGAEFAKFLLEEAIRLAKSTVGFDGYLERLEAELAGVENLISSLQGKYADWRMGYVQIDFARIPAYRGEEKELADEIKALRNEAKDAIGKMGKTYFAYSEEMQTELIRSLYPLAKGLSSLTKQFMEQFALAKKEKLMMDFSDYEHFALRVLVEKGSTLEHIIPTEAAMQIQDRYDEIMIDEYQDSNMVQEMILSAVSGESKGQNNRFMVGDMKQSIYRFRLAMPEMFREKYLAYPAVAGGKTRRIVLSKNFRSRKNVLDSANFLFRQLMRAEFGDVEYDDEAALYDGATFPDFKGRCGGACEMMLVETATSEGSQLPEELEELDRRQLEAVMIAKKIKGMMAEGYHVVDKETGAYRPLEFRDVAILMRSVKNWGSVLDEVFGNEEIPYYAEVAEGYFDVPEVDTVVQILRLIDNPRQDIPVISVLHSPLYRLSSDELMQVRLIGKDGMFYDCVQSYVQFGEDVEISEKLMRFLADLSRWRGAMRDLTLYELIRMVYDESGYFDYVGVTSGGALRQANLRLLLEKAKQYEAGKRKGVFYFIRYIEDLKTAEAETSAAKLQSEAENLVRVMTIHKSKGLEFPVVFLADTAKKFNEMDTREAVITHQVWGYGMDYMDIAQRAVYRTLSKTALAEAIRLENLSEELRVLYVALTRAKEKLIITGTQKDLLKSATKWRMSATGEEKQIPIFRMRRGAGYLDWLMPALLRHPNARANYERLGIDEGSIPHLFIGEPSTWQFHFYSREEMLSDIAQEKRVLGGCEEVFSSWDSAKDYSGRRTEVFRVLSWKYPHEKATRLPTKVSISEIKRRNQEELTGEYPQPSIGVAPTRTKADGALSAAEIGTAIHAVMEEADFKLMYDAEQLDGLIASMVENGRLSEAESRAIRRKELLAFFSSDLAQRMLGVDVRKIEKERPFAMLMKAAEVLGEREFADVDEDILINGIIDCYFVEDDGKVVLVDYKSDRIYQDAVFIEKYHLQLELYRRALVSALGMDVAEGYIYSFAMGRTVRVF